jgi:hypothetical protein
MTDDNQRQEDATGSNRSRLVVTEVAHEDQGNTPDENGDVDSDKNRQEPTTGDMSQHIAHEYSDWKSLG